MPRDREPRRQRRRDDELRILALAGRQAIEALERRLAEPGVRRAKLPAERLAEKRPLRIVVRHE